MNTIFASIAVALLALCATIPVFLMGFSLEMNEAGSSASFITVAVWIAFLLIAQPVVVIPAVIIKSVIVGAVRLVK